jgi:hypothetical protein
MMLNPSSNDVMLDPGSGGGELAYLLHESELRFEAVELSGVSASCGNDHAAFAR